MLNATLNRVRTWLVDYRGTLAVVGLSLLLALATIEWVGGDLSTFSSRLQPFHDGDLLLNSWTMYQAYDNLLHRPFNLGYSGIFYDEPASFAYTIAPYGIAVFTLPVYLLTGNDLLLTYNLYLVATFVLTAWAFYALVRYLLSAPRTAAIIMALAVTFSQWRLTQIVHIESLSTQFLLCAIYAFHRLVDEARWRWVFLLSGAFFFTFLSSGYLGMFLIVMAATIALYLVARYPDRLTLRVLGMLSAAAVIAIVVCLPFLLYRLDNPDFRAGYTLNEVFTHSASLDALVRGNTLIYHDLISGDITEGALFPGFSVLVLALLGWMWRHHGGKPNVEATASDEAVQDGTKTAVRIALTPRDVVSVYGVIIVVGVVLCLGPVLRIDDNEIAPLPYHLLYQLPGFSSMRVIARFFLLAVLGFGVLGTHALGVLMSRGNSLQVFVGLVALTGLLTIELVPVNRTISTPNNRIFDLHNEQKDVVSSYPDKSALNEWLAEQPDDTVIFHYPLWSEVPRAGYLCEYSYLFDQRLHGLKMFNGWGSLLPNQYLRYANFPEVNIVARLYQKGVRYALVHNDFLTASEQQQLRDRLESNNRAFTLPYMTSVDGVDIYDLQAVQLTGFATEPQGLVYEFDQPAFGMGWHSPGFSDDGATVQWMAESEATFHVPWGDEASLLPGTNLDVTFAAITLTPEMFDGFYAQVGDTDLPIQPTSEDGVFVLHIPHTVLPTDARTFMIEFYTDATITAAEAGVGEEDEYRVAVGFDWLRVQSVYDPTVGEPLVFEFGSPVPGVGWENPERLDAATWTWMNATEATFALALASSAELEVTFQVANVLDQALLDGVVLLVNGEPVALERTTLDSADVFTGVLPLSEAGQIVLTFQIEQTVSLAELDPSSPDMRQLGLALDWLRLAPVSENS
ncbi:MAG: glycosyltransferase family 39 protein [Chloroflexi bacterium]|nr:glycosyltransferase family 39 protein [Chloroflexota bacterium]